MKKKNLNSLRLRKSTISSLNTQQIIGGDIIIIITLRPPCPRPQPKTNTTCSEFTDCNSIDICSKGICKPIDNTTQAPV
ncbi:MAG: class I lanthipeptide [Bacteroidota bacterium]